MGINARGLWDVSTDVGDPPYVNGYWYLAGMASVANGAVIPANRLSMVPFKIRRVVNIQQLGARINTLAAGGNIQLAIYAANHDTLQPTGQPVARTGNIATDAVGNVAAPLANGNAAGQVQLQPGIYWFAINVDAAAGGTVAMQAMSATDAFHSSLIGGSSQTTIAFAATTGTYIRTLNTTFGTWPDLTGQATTETIAQTCALGQFQVAA